MLAVSAEPGSEGGKVTPAGGSFQVGRTGGTDQSAALLKSTSPPVNRAPSKLTVPPVKRASSKLTVVPPLAWNPGATPGVQARGGSDAVKSRNRHLALMTCLAVRLAACATMAPRPVADGAVPAVHSPDRHARARAGCPLGRLLPPGQGIAIDYVDFLRFADRTYVAGAESAGAIRLGRVITHVRCSLVAEEDQRHAAPPLIDGTASFLGAGSAVYQVRGFAESCRLAAYLSGRLRVYLAQTSVHHQSAPVPCASHRPPART